MDAITYVVNGMSCEHCRSAVADEVGELEGVESVEVDLASGWLQVRGEASQAAIAAAVANAGYELAGRHE